MYTGLVIEELLALVERAEESTRHSRRSLDREAKPGLRLTQDWTLLNEERLLAGVA